MLFFANRPFYSCVLSYLVFECKRGWRWPCFVRGSQSLHWETQIFSLMRFLNDVYANPDGLASIVRNYLIVSILPSSGRRERLVTGASCCTDQRRRGFHRLACTFLSDNLFSFYKNIFYKNTEAKICEIFRN